MLVARVRGSVWATKKEESLKGYRLLVVEPVDVGGNNTGSSFVAADRIGAGAGEMVLVVCGSSARLATDRGQEPVDAVVVGIIDSMEINEANSRQ